MFKFLSDEENNEFSWESIGDMSIGRENLGDEMPVSVYRLFQFTIRSILNKRYGAEECIEIFREAGELAGSKFAENMLDLSLPFDNFVSHLQKTLNEAKIGVLRAEEINDDKSEMVLSVAEDLDCSGLPVSGETVCNYDEGFIAGILNTYTGKKFTVREVDCWSKGDRVCRFNAKAE